MTQSPPEFELRWQTIKSYDNQGWLSEVMRSPMLSIQGVNLKTDLIAVKIDNTWFTAASEHTRAYLDRAWEETKN